MIQLRITCRRRQFAVERCFVKFQTNLVLATFRRAIVWSALHWKLVMQNATPQLHLGSPDCFQTYAAPQIVSHDAAVFGIPYNQLDLFGNQRAGQFFRQC